MGLQHFTVQNFSGYLKEKIPNLIPEEYVEKPDYLQFMIDYYIFSRLEMFIRHSKDVYFYPEDSYVESEWKDMISLHYINTSYKFEPRVIRVHLFSKKSVIKENYLGFFTIRKINEFSSLLSYIYPNFSVLKKWDKAPKSTNRINFYMMFIKKHVHILDQRFTIWTFPMFVFDGTVATCCHSAIISMAGYLHKKFDFHSISLKDIYSKVTYRKKKDFPTEGMNIYQVQELLSKKKVPIIISTLKVVQNKTPNMDPNLNTSKNEIIKEFQGIIDSQVESGIPVMILGNFVDENESDIKYHVILIIGHTESKNGKKYIIYDTSGYLLGKICGHRNIIGTVCWEDLLNCSVEISFLSAEHERVYLSWSNIKYHLKYNLLKIDRPDNISQIFEDDSNYLFKFKSIRYLLAESAHVKYLFSQCLSNEDIFPGSKENIQRVIDMELPHFVWYCECCITAGAYFILIADATYNAKTPTNVFINQNIIIGKQMSILLKQGTYPAIEDKGILTDAPRGIKNTHYQKEKRET